MPLSVARPRRSLPVRAVGAGLLTVASLTATLTAFQLDHARRAMVAFVVAAAFATSSAAAAVVRAFG